MSLKQEITEAFDILTKVRGISSTKSKQEILSTGTDNQVLKTILLLTYNPSIQFYIKKIPNVKPQGEEISEVTYANFLSLLSQLKTRAITGNAAINALSEFLKTCTTEEFDWYTKVVQRDIKCGIADKNINKVFGNIIPIYEVLLADKFEQHDLELNTDKALKLLPPKFVVEPKLDGMRLNIWTFPDGRIELYSRNGKMIYGYDNLVKDAAKLPKGYVYDGELMSAEFEKTLEKAKSGAITIEHLESDCYQDLMTSAFAKIDHKEGIYNLFDRVPIKEFESKKTTETLQDRKEWISKNLSDIDFDCIKIVEWSSVLNKDDDADRQKAVSLMRYFLSIGYEGAMVKDWSSKYEFKRSKSLLKMKLMDLIDLVVTDLYEGETGSKYEGMMGGVTCDYNGYPLGVGSGWTDSEREYYWSHPEEIIGKTISVSYQNKSKNLDGGESLRFPVKKIIRFDK
jgi:DNA ligase-1